MKLNRAIGVLFGLSLAISCNTGHIGSTLKDVESYIQDAPDSARAALERLDLSRTPKQLRAKYSLFHTIALDKTDKFIDDLGVILPAAEYYELHGKKQYRMMSQFYLGRIYLYKNDAVSAIVALRKALSIAEATNQTYWKAMCYSDIGWAHHQNYLYEGELEYFSRAMESWNEYGDSVHIRQAISSLALAYHNNRCFDTADSLYFLLCDGNPLDYYVYPLRADNEIKRPYPDFNKVVEWYNVACKNAEYMIVDDYYQYSYALYRTGEKNKSDGILRQLTGYDNSLSGTKWKGEIAQREGDYRAALDMFRQHMFLADSIVHTQLCQSIIKSEAQYYETEMMVSKIKQNNMRLIIVIALIVFIAGSIIYVLYHSKKEQKYQADLERITLYAEECKKQYEQLNISSRRKKNSKNQEPLLEQLRESLMSNYRNSFKKIGEMIETKAFYGEASHRKSMEEIESLISEIKNDIKSQNRFEDRLNRDLDGIMEKLRIDYPNFSDNDFRFLSYLIVGFDATTRAVLLNSNLNNMRVKKSRLLKYIKLHPTNNSKLYYYLLRE
ncbi:MAG: hypothetical protein KBS55_06450 [Bacteroidales bacterium]|nr:hypothetical protein [Candidatus Cryptobacteroides aphodequi]